MIHIFQQPEPTLPSLRDYIWVKKEEFRICKALFLSAGFLRFDQFFHSTYVPVTGYPIGITLTIVGASDIFGYMIAQK